MVRCENDYFAFSYNKNRYIGVKRDESGEILGIKNNSSRYSLCAIVLRYNDCKSSLHNLSNYHITNKIYYLEFIISSRQFLIHILF